MHISKISNINFNGNTSRIIKKTTQDADMKFIEEVLKPKDEFVNYNQSSYSVPTGFLPSKKQPVERYPFVPEDSIITKGYVKEKQAAKQTEEVIDYVSESTIK